MTEINIVGNYKESGPTKQKIKDAVEAVFLEINNSKLTIQNYSVNIAFVSDAEIQAKNKEYRHKDAPTDVLSFDYDDEGDILLSVAQIEELKEKDETLYDAILKTIIHGVLHLLGFDHENESDRAIMNEKEIKVFESLK